LLTGTVVAVVARMLVLLFAPLRSLARANDIASALPPAVLSPRPLHTHPAVLLLVSMRPPFFFFFFVHCPRP